MAAAGLILGDLFTELKAANGQPSSTRTFLGRACIALVCILLIVGSVLECSPRHRSEAWGTRAWLGDVFSGIRRFIPAELLCGSEQPRSILAVFA